MLKILPPIWFMFFFIGALVLHFFVPASHVFDYSFPFSSYIGIAIALLAWALPLTASKIFAEEKTEIIPTSSTNRVLIERGPYRFIRNPMYLGMVVQLLGAALALGTLPMYLAALAHFLIMNFVFIPFEEEKMARQFPDAYAAYRARVRKWL